MNNTAANPFSDADYQKINNQLAELERLRQQIQQAALAGCSVGDTSQHCEQLIAQLNQLKQVYFRDRQ